MIKRTLNSEFINFIANQKDVFDLIKVGNQKSIDISEALGDHSNYLLVNENGGFLFINIGYSSYEVHTIFPPKSNTFEAAREAAAYMFSKTDCFRICTKVPVHNIDARKLTEKMGFKKVFDRQNALSINDKLVDVDYFELTIDDWVMQSNDCLEKGRWFHYNIGDHKNHEDDLIHDKYAGAAALLIQNGQIQKGINLYNRWANFSGYLPISIHSEDPLIIDIIECMIHVNGDQLEVISCQ